MMSYNFYAFLNRMKYIKRWSLMHNVKEENIMEHSQNVAVIAHALAEIGNVFFGENNDSAKIALIALFHESGEVITGDLPTPIKYYNKDINKAYKNLEDLAENKLLGMLPPELAEAYSGIIKADKSSPEYKIVKTADKLAAYIKCLEELKSGNGEFKKAESQIKTELEKIDLPALRYFNEHFLESYSLTLDELDM